MSNTPHPTDAARRALRLAARQLDHAYQNMLRAGLDRMGDDYDWQREGEHVVEALMVVMANLDGVQDRDERRRAEGLRCGNSVGTAVP